jgi:hypothetical protein
MYSRNVKKEFFGDRRRRGSAAVAALSRFPHCEQRLFRRLREVEGGCGRGEPETALLTAI